VGPSADLDTVGKGKNIFGLVGNRTLGVQPVARRYTGSIDKDKMDEFAEF
jgi:hypothetical protein